MKTTDTITIKAVSHKSTEELDFEMYDDVLGKGWEDGDVNKIYINQDLSDSAPVKIDDLRKILDKLKKEGCNYVSIDFHCDHIEYDLYGFDIHSATEQEIDDFKAFKADEKRKEIDDINSKLEKLEKEREKLIQSLFEK